jgi:hypothetical protein
MPNSLPAMGASPDERQRSRKDRCRAQSQWPAHSSTGFQSSGSAPSEPVHPLMLAGSTRPRTFSYSFGGKGWEGALPLHACLRRWGGRMKKKGRSTCHSWGGPKHSRLAYGIQSSGPAFGWLRLVRLVIIQRYYQFPPCLRVTEGASPCCRVAS